MQSGQLIFLLLIGVVFYLFLIAPTRRRQRQMMEMQARLEPGVQVMTTAGLFAVVHAVNDDSVDLEVAPGVVNRYAKAAISKVVTPADPDDLALDDDAPAELDSTAEPEGRDGADGPAGASDDEAPGDAPPRPTGS